MFLQDPEGGRSHLQKPGMKIQDRLVRRACEHALLVCRSPDNPDNISDNWTALREYSGTAHGSALRPGSRRRKGRSCIPLPSTLLHGPPDPDGRRRQSSERTWRAGIRSRSRSVPGNHTRNIRCKAPTPPYSLRYRTDSVPARNPLRFQRNSDTDVPDSLHARAS